MRVIAGINGHTGALFTLSVDPGVDDWSSTPREDDGGVRILIDDAEDSGQIKLVMDREAAIRMVVEVVRSL